MPGHCTPSMHTPAAALPSQHEENRPLEWWKFAGIVEQTPARAGFDSTLGYARSTQCQTALSNGSFVIAASASFATTEDRSGSSIAAECRAASISSPKASAWRSTRSRRRKVHARATSVQNSDRTLLNPLKPLKIILFDIDGTLILTGGAGSRAMGRAFEDAFGIARAFDGIPMAGRTDRRILDAAAAHAGVTLDAAARRRFRDRYAARLLEALPEPGHSSRVLPGVEPLLQTLTPHPDFFVALLTGNCEQGAKLKLEHFDLWRFFRCGAFGDEVHDRNDLFAVAMQRARECGAPSIVAEDVIVVGDTELDVACAAAAGARSVAVATGSSTSEALRQSGADVVFEDLSDVNEFLRLL
jgi:phosphoglycolate phosphatase